ncbi:unnamed protein product, partial [Allacma fusca]
QLVNHIENSVQISYHDSLNGNKGFVKLIKSTTLLDLLRRSFNKTVSKVEIAPIYQNIAHDCCVAVVGLWCQQVMAGVDLCDPTGEAEVLIFKERMRLLATSG